jgi:hypothetical protein
MVISSHIIVLMEKVEIQCGDVGKEGKKCRSSIRTRGQFILEQLKEHNHNPDHLILVQNIDPMIPSIL